MYGKNNKANASNRGKQLARNNNQNNNQYNQNNRNNRNNSSGSGNSKYQKNSASGQSSANKNKVQKINNLQQAAAASASGANKSSSHRRLESYLMSVKDPSIRRWLSKSCNSNGSSCNETRLQHLADKHEKKPPTPAKKRSSLARPVRVHDSFPQENAPVVVDWNESENLQNQQVQQQMHQQRLRHPDEKMKKKHKDKDEKKKKQQHQRLEQAIDDLVEIRVDEEVTTLPIRLRLGEFFELSLPKCRRRKRRRRHRMMIATMREKTMKSMMEAGGMRAGGAFKDTERLLKVLSINNVDQDNRYNVTRCSVM